MPVSLRPFVDADLPSVVALSLRAWGPVFPSIEASLGSDVYRALEPDPFDAQRRAVEHTCADDAMEVWVAVDDGVVAGFVALQLSGALGVVDMVAVDPDHQRRGIGLALVQHALRRTEEMGVPVAMVETGTDPGHAPARALYEKAGYRLVTVARYWKRV
jgi:ribosomal protein S18 acetylase RimI-like enzyme